MACVWSRQKTIAASNGVTAIVERLSAEAGDDVAEMLTAILWNLSSCSVNSPVTAYVCYKLVARPMID